MKIATMTLKQLSTLRLMLRLQKVKALRLGLQKFRAGSINETQALAEILKKEDLINAADIGLMISEHAASAHHVIPDPNAPVNIAFDDSHLHLCKVFAEAPYAADGSMGSQAEQGVVLQVIKEDSDGIRVALATATSPDEVATPIIQAQPRGRQ